MEEKDFPGGPLAKTAHSHCKEPRSLIPGQGTRSHMSKELDPTSLGLTYSQK